MVNHTLNVLPTLNDH